MLAPMMLRNAVLKLWQKTENCGQSNMEPMKSKQEILDEFDRLIAAVFEAGEKHLRSLSQDAAPEKANSKDVKYVRDNWLVRESINHELNDKIVLIANTILDDQLDENDTSMVLNVIQEFIDISEWTGDETDHAIESVQLMCAMLFANRLGAQIDVESVIDFLNKECDL